MTIQEQYNLIREGKGDKNFFMKSIRNTFPQHINQYTSFKDAITILKNKSLITEEIVSSTSENWFSIFKEKINEAKSIEKETSKEVLDDQENAFQSSDKKNIDNIYGQSFLNGYYAEMKDPKNNEKSVDELKDIVAKNMAKDINYYAKNAMFGEKGVGYTDEAPSLRATKEPKGKTKSSGYGDLEIEGDLNIDINTAKKNVKDTLSDSEAKTNMPKKVKEMEVTPQSSKGVKKMAMPGKEKKVRLVKEEQETDEILTLAPELEKLRGNNPEDLYFNRIKDLSAEAKDTLIKAGYNVKFEDIQDVGEDETPWHIYKITKNINESVRTLIKQIIREELI